MDKQRTFQILQDLGGRARYKQIFKKIHEAEPYCSYADAGRPLGLLRKWGEVKYDNNTMEWFIPK